MPCTYETQALFVNAVPNLSPPESKLRMENQRSDRGFKLWQTLEDFLVFLKVDVRLNFVLHFCITKHVQIQKKLVQIHFLIKLKQLQCSEKHTSQTLCDELNIRRLIIRTSPHSAVHGLFKLARISWDTQSVTESNSGGKI